MNLDSLIQAEGWEVIHKSGTKQVKAFDQIYPYTHPVQIYFKLYRTTPSTELKYQYMKKCHDILWPEMALTFTYWDERRFRAHCDGCKNISYAGGAGTGKSLTAAKIAVLYWLANPKKRAVIVASTTLESLNSRIFGYCINLLTSMAVKIPYTYYRGNSPKVLLDNTDQQHGIYAIAAKQGDDERAISSWIGRHPKEGILIVLDEATDMPHQLLSALPNLESGVENFQCIAIGNSNSKFDLHGSFSTPEEGWESVDPLVDTQWKTTQKQGICLFFSCYESPAIFETDPIKKKKLSKFLVTKEQVAEKENLLGRDSDLFYRFVLGFWKNTSTDRTVVSKAFLDGYNIHDKAEWLGVNPLRKVAGLDPAFSTNGDKCLLQIGVLGQTIDGGIVLDYRGKDLLFDIKIKARSDKSAELQIAEQVCDILIREGVSLGDLAIDSNGQGRALGGTIYLEMTRRVGHLKEPLKIYSTKGGSNVVNSFGMIIKTTLELWSTMRDFIEHNQIKGLDVIATTQLAHRWIIQDKISFKQRLETKSEFKKRMGAVLPSMAHSPDEADAAVICLMSAIHNYGFTLGQRKDPPRVQTFAHEKLIEFQAGNRQIAMEEESWNPTADFSGTLNDLVSNRKPF